LHCFVTAIFNLTVSAISRNYPKILNGIVLRFSYKLLFLNQLRVHLNSVKARAAKAKMPTSTIISATVKSGLRTAIRRSLRRAGSGRQASPVTIAQEWMVSTTVLFVVAASGDGSWLFCRTSWQTRTRFRDGMFGIQELEGLLADIAEICVEADGIGLNGPARTWMELTRAQLTRLPFELNDNRTRRCRR
jgi:hypothetical protein